MQFSTWYAYNDTCAGSSMQAYANADFDELEMLGAGALTMIAVTCLADLGCIAYYTMSKLLSKQININIELNFSGTKKTQQVFDSLAEKKPS